MLRFFIALISLVIFIYILLFFHSWFCTFFSFSGLYTSKQTYIALIYHEFVDILSSLDNCHLKFSFYCSGYTVDAGSEAFSPLQEIYMHR